MLFGILSMLSVTFACHTANAETTLRIATEGYYAPFNYFDANGALAGFDIDISLALCAEMALECELVQNDWEDLMLGLNDRQYDVIVASMSITAEREKQVAFTLPYYSNMLTFVGKKNSGIEISADGLTGKTVGALRSTVSSNYLEETYDGIVDVRLYDTQDDALADLTSGQLDLVLGDNLPSYDWLQSGSGKDHAFVGEFIDTNDRIGIAVRHTDTDLLDQLNAALIAIIENGTYQQISTKYFPFSIYF
jgi:polar amino acid transport system substrate-binding protein